MPPCQQCARCRAQQASQAADHLHIDSSVRALAQRFDSLSSDTGMLIETRSVDDMLPAHGGYQGDPLSIAGHRAAAEPAGAAGMLQLLLVRRPRPAAESPPQQSCNMKHSSNCAGQCIRYDAIDRSLATDAKHSISPGLLRCQHLMCRSAQRHGTDQQRAESRASTPQSRHQTCQRGSRTPCQTVAATLVGRHVTVTVSDTMCRPMASNRFLGHPAHLSTCIRVCA
jgi:hypothetical protein